MTKQNRNVMGSLTTVAVIATVLVAGLSGCATQPSAEGVKTQAEEVKAQAKEDATARAIAGAEQELTDAEKETAGTLLVYSEKEAGAPGFITRIFVNAKYMQMSDTRSPADYVLFNRDERTIYNVNGEDETIFVVQPKPVTAKPPFELTFTAESQPSNAIPKIDGRQATHYRFYANGEHCYDSVTIGEGFMEDVLAAMRDFRQVLAGEHATTVNATPIDMQNACDLSMNVFHATDYMEKGLPIREWGRNGYQRFLKDYHVGVVVAGGIIELPKDFQRYSVGDELPEK
ncbi:MAG: hypothetical protein GXP17_05310 [Gammaproteobacteria bacterium]|nr:hypothetical protein [Gammaproteobacteria bacterium]